MGHVPPGALSEAGDGAQLPGRQHRGAGARRPTLSRAEIGSLGERLAAERYAVWGFRVLGRNVRAAGAECDLLVTGTAGRVVVEVKTVTDGDPFAQVDDAKERSLRRLA
ncbi:MAG: YraN family protein, partial [Acidimicrobiia bacterium]